MTQEYIGEDVPRRRVMSITGQQPHASSSLKHLTSCGGKLANRKTLVRSHSFDNIISPAVDSMLSGRDISAWNYCAAELGLRVGQREDDPDMAAARERVFDVIWNIPHEVERLNLYGSLICADAILAVVTSLPVRVACQTARLLASPILIAPTRLSKRRAWGFHPYAREHLSDVLWLCILLFAVASTHAVDVSVMYHYIRGQDVIKLYMACYVLETFDKLCCAFNGNVLDALQHSVFKCVDAASRGTWWDQTHAVSWLSVDVLLAGSCVCAHSFILLTHAVTLSVAVNSHANALLLVLVSNNFAELKSHAFKRMEGEKLFAVVRMDVVERVHLTVCLLFVVAQRIAAAGSVGAALTLRMARDVTMVLGSEVFVDLLKHAFMSKFNNLRPETYRRFLRQMCREHVMLAQSYKLHRVVGFTPLAPAAVLLRVLPDVLRTLRGGDGAADHASAEVAHILGTWNRREAAMWVIVGLSAVAIKLCFGLVIHWWGSRMLDKLRLPGENNEQSEESLGYSRGATPQPSPPKPYSTIKPPQAEVQSRPSRQRKME